MISYNIDLLDFIKKSEVLAQYIVKKEYQKSDFIIQQGNNSQYVYFIDSGVTKCYITESNGKDYILEFIGKGEVIGEVEVFFDESTYISNIEAITDVGLYRIPNERYVQMLKDDWIFNKLIMQNLSSRLKKISTRVSYQQSHKMEYAVLKLFQLLSKESISISKRDIASYLGVSKRSLNRVLKDLSQRGIIDSKSMTLNVNYNNINKSYYN